MKENGPDGVQAAGIAQQLDAVESTKNAIPATCQVPRIKRAVRSGIASRLTHIRISLPALSFLKGDER